MAPTTQITSAAQITPTSGLVSAARTPTEIAPNSTTTNHLNASASDLSGLCIPPVFTRPREKSSCLHNVRLEDVHSQENDDPHDVDEVPVDARHLDAEVVLGLGPEMAAEGADRGEAEQHQADEDVGAVQSREAVEDRAEGQVPGAEADVRVLVDLDEEEGRAEHPGQHEAEFEAFAVALADRLQGVVDREARGDEDAGVDEGDVHRQFVGIRRPVGRADDDAEEEVGGEESAEEHDLGDDEE